jgi:hypothetical protein
MRKCVRIRSALFAAVSFGLLTAPAFAASDELAKARASAFLKSLILPGWGQYTSGHKTAAAMFAMTELAFLGGMYGFHSYGVAKRQDYKAYAAQYADVVGDHPHDFYVDVGNWDRVEDYNEERLKDREFDRLYTSASDSWQWDSNEHRVRMKKIRVQSDKAFNGVYYLVGGLVLNHLASAIHAGRTAHVPASTSSSLRDWHLFFTSSPDRKGLSVHLNCSF